LDARQPSNRESDPLLRVCPYPPMLTWFAYNDEYGGDPAVVREWRREIKPNTESKIKKAKIPVGQPGLEA
jgi:hypothetical protein